MCFNEYGKNIYFQEFVSETLRFRYHKFHDIKFPDYIFSTKNWLRNYILSMCSEMDYDLSLKFHSTKK